MPLLMLGTVTMKAAAKSVGEAVKKLTVMRMRVMRNVGNETREEEFLVSQTLK